jgi:hypothetical protein
MNMVVQNNHNFALIKIHASTSRNLYMVLYNVTIGIDAQVELEWLEWMKTMHIPAVMSTGQFIENKIFKVVSEEEEETVSYSIQYFAKDVEHVVKYLNEFAAPLVEEHKNRYQNRHVAFRTLLEQVS